MAAILSILWSRAGELLIAILGVALVIWQDPSREAHNGRAQH